MVLLVLLNNLNIDPVLICSGLPLYLNADVQKKQIVTENKDKAGIYL
jgi:hypothetical protein